MCLLLSARDRVELESMWTILALLCLLAPGCLAQTPQPCKSPTLTGSISVSALTEKKWLLASYMYDAAGQRLHIKDLKQAGNATLDVSLLFTEGVLYRIDEERQKCSKEALDTSFQPMVIPAAASLIGNVVFGVLSEPGQRLQSNTWLANDTGSLVYSVTERGCIPISILSQSDRYGWVIISFFNNAVGISDPAQINLPDFCKGVEIEDTDGEKPADFLSLFLNI
ncbi:ependymin-1-like [Polymixia lowei]